MDKNELRIKYREIRKNIPEEKRIEESQKITEQLIGLIKENSFDAVLLYAPKKFEADVTGVFKKAGISVYFPRCDKDEMDFYKAYDLSELKPGNFNVREPEEYCPKFVPKENEKYLIVVPGICFDKNGYRIGYGKGYYDKYLSRYKDYDFYKTGVCFSECLTEDTFHDDFDIKTDTVIY
ncbi:MAG: 5-formyltetrahydrofolate cyclo-ligase [Lachnospiraceae bacterium]|nr:5-formyltetrahydrofolate cyclo-ligase [Lachnospiraceae bacterium]